MDIKWNEIVDIYNSYGNESEDYIQNIWEQIFSEIFGYSRLRNEIVSKRSIQIGSSERIIPDIIITDNTHDLFVVELKQPRARYNEEQIISYLRLLKVDIGILISNKITLVYIDNKEEHKIDISFIRDNQDGINFIDLFSKKISIKIILLILLKKNCNLREI